MQARFRDRQHAGRSLAEMLRTYQGRSDVLVLGLARGGVVVAAEVAEALRAPLDVFVVRKLGVPGHEELAMGAIASGGIVVLHHDVARQLGIARTDIDDAIARETVELERRERVYRDGRSPADPGGRVVILVDDGLATGSTMRAAVAAVRRASPARVVVAVPVGAPETCDALRDDADEVVCATTPEPFFGVGMWYERFEQTSDDQVRRLLAQGGPVGTNPRRETPSPPKEGSQMHVSPVDTLNATFQKTNQWLRELAHEAQFITEPQAYSALRAVLHALRDRLTVDEAAHLAAQMPMLVRGLYYEGWKPAATPRRQRTLEQFLAGVRRDLGNAEVDPLHACRAVFAFLSHKIAQGEIDDVRHMLPEEVRHLWPTEVLR